MRPGRDVAWCLKRWSLYETPVQSSCTACRMEWLHFPIGGGKTKTPHLSTAGTDRMDYVLTVTFPGFKCDHQSFMLISKLSCVHVNVRWSDFYYKTQPSPGSFPKADQKHKALVTCCFSCPVLEHTSNARWSNSACDFKQGRLEKLRMSSWNKTAPSTVTRIGAELLSMVYLKLFTTYKQWFQGTLQYLSCIKILISNSKFVKEYNLVFWEPSKNKSQILKIQFHRINSLKQ